jgi:hypothetical protein
MITRFLLNHDKRRGGTVFSPLGIRVYGILHVLEGVFLVLGGLAAQKSRPVKISMKYIMWSTENSSRIYRENNPSPPPEPEPEYCKAKCLLVNNSDLGYSQEIECDREKGHEGPHEGWQGGVYAWRRKGVVVIIPSQLSTTEAVDRFEGVTARNRANDAEDPDGSSK